MQDFLESIWHIVGIVAACVAILLILTICFADKNVDGYYLSHGDGREGAAVCVYAHWTWHTDELAYCTDDANKALDFLVRANQTLVKPK